MAQHGDIRSWLAPVLLMLLANTGCSGASLGDFDDSKDAREEMPGPGVFADEDGKSPLTWSSDSQEPEPTAYPAAVTASATTSTTAPTSPEQAEFEQFKAWNELRNNGADSAEYQEFLQWLEYQKFKASQ